METSLSISLRDLVGIVTEKQSSPSLGLLVNSNLEKFSPSEVKTTANLCPSVAADSNDLFLNFS